MQVIRQSMFLRDTAENIYTALTSKEDIEQWWGLVNPDADGITIWHGMDRQYEVPIVAMEAGKSLSFAFDAHHPYDSERTEFTTITFSIEEIGNDSIVTVVQSMFPDDEWNTLIHDSWVYSLLSLQVWVERGIPFSHWMDASKFHIVDKTIAIDADAEWVWRNLTQGHRLERWLELPMTSTPVVGGMLAIGEGDNSTEGAWTLLSEPRNLVSSVNSLVQHWTIIPGMSGCAVRLAEYGHDLSTLKRRQIRAIDAAWDRRLERLQAMARPEESGHL